MLSRWPFYWSLPSEARWCCPDDSLIEVSHQKQDDIAQMTLLLKSPIRSMMMLSRWPSYWSLPSEAWWCCPDDPLTEVSHQKHDGVVQMTLLLKSPIRSKMMLSRWPSYWSLPSEAWWCCPDDPLTEVSHQKQDDVQMTLLLKSPIRSMMMLSRWPSYGSLPSEAWWCLHSCLQLAVEMDFTSLSAALLMRAQATMTESLEYLEFLLTQNRHSVVKFHCNRVLSCFLFMMRPTPSWWLLSCLPGLMIPGVSLCLLLPVHLPSINASTARFISSSVCNNFPVWIQVHTFQHPTRICCFCC